MFSTSDHPSHSYLTVQGLTKSYDHGPVLRDVSFVLAADEMISIIGPSGSGKTTLLKLLAQIESPDEGSISFSFVPSNRRPVILVFQDYLLFPHMTVADNVAFGLKSRGGLSRSLIRRKVDEYLDYFSISEKAGAYPAHLSGGQRQRVALARALILEPALLLLDEPFANLDKNLKMETARFVRETVRTFNCPTITATHDLEEAAVVSDRIGVLQEGALLQMDTVRNLYFSPATLTVARFLGPINRIDAAEYRLFRFCCGKSGPKLRPFVHVRAQSLSVDGSSDGPGQIDGFAYLGSSILYDVRLGDQTYKVSSMNHDLAVGDKVQLTVGHYF